MRSTVQDDGIHRVLSLRIVFSIPKVVRMAANIEFGIRGRAGIDPLREPANAPGIRDLGRQVA